MSHIVKGRLKHKDKESLIEAMKKQGWEIKNGKCQMYYNEVDADIVFKKNNVKYNIGFNKNKDNEYEMECDSYALKHFNENNLMRDETKYITTKELEDKGFLIEIEENDKTLITGTRYCNKGKEMVEVKIANGEIKLETYGFTGRRCYEATYDLQKKLGIEHNEPEYKQEWFGGQNIDQTIQNGWGMCG